jgi:hypothetical protein
MAHRQRSRKQTPAPEQQMAPPQREQPMEFALPASVEHYLRLLTQQQELRAAIAALKPGVKTWLVTLPKQSLELAAGSKLKLVHITSRTMKEEHVRASLEQFLNQSSIEATPLQAKAFAATATTFIYTNRPKHTTRQLQKTGPRAQTRRAVDVLISE